MSVTNKPLSNPEKTQGQVSSVGSTTASYTGAPIPEFTKILGDFSLTTYKFEDGSSGIALYNGKVAFHIDNNNNMIFTAGSPSQSGCGGKMVMSSEANIQKSGSVSIEVTGRPDDGEVKKETTGDGNISETKLPAYSLKVYGDILIECVGGDVAIKGDNISLNARNTLNLTSGKDINIQAGQESGKININAGTVDLKSAFFNRDITGGEYSKGTGESSVEQYNPSAKTSISTPGSIKYTVNGDYEVGVTGNYKQIVNGNYSIGVDKDFALTVGANYSEKIQGKAKTLISGLKSKPESSQQETYILELGAAKSKADSFKIKSGSGIKAETTTGGFVAEIGKQLGKLELTDKEFNLTVGKNLGKIQLTQKEATLSFGAKNKVSVKPDRITIEATAIYLN